MSDTNDDGMLESAMAEYAAKHFDDVSAELARVKAERDGYAQRANAYERERDEARAKVERLTRERDDAVRGDATYAQAVANDTDLDAANARADLAEAERDEFMRQRDRACGEAVRLRGQLDEAFGYISNFVNGGRPIEGACRFIERASDTLSSAPESSAWLEAKLAEAYARGFREARDAALAIIRETPFAAGTLVGAKQADMRRRMEERVAALAPSAERAEPAPVCATCGDTHVMALGDRRVNCTACPTPCGKCRDGAYCAQTPCRCSCHAKPVCATCGGSGRVPDKHFTAFTLLYKPCPTCGGGR
jgi:hypothetical protein